MVDATLNKYLMHGWLELPFLVDQFVQEVAPALRASTESLRSTVAEIAGLETYDNISKVCRVMGEIHAVVMRAYDDMDLEDANGNEHQRGLLAAAMKAWHEDEDFAAIEDVDLEEIQPLRAIPWRVWAEWEKNDDEANKVLNSHGKNSVQLRAWEVLRRFVLSAQEWRQEVLDSFTVVKSGTPLGCLPIDLGVALLANKQWATKARVDQDLESLLSARGFSGTVVLGVNGPILRFLQQEEEPLQLSGWMKIHHEKLLQRIEEGESILQVRVLREHFRWFEPGFVDGAYEDGPCMWQLLARLGDDSYVQVSTEKADEGLSSISPYATVYVERDEDIPPVLRCMGAGAAGMHVVTRCEALNENLPHIAGWYAIRLWE